MTDIHETRWGSFVRGRQHVKHFFSAAAIAGLLMSMAAACGDDSSGDEEGNAAPQDEAETQSDFPADVQPLVEDLPQPVYDMLLAVRNEGPGELVWKDGGGALHEGFQAAYLEDWERITGWTVISSAPSTSPGELQVQVDSGSPEWDLVETGTAALVMESEGLLEEFSPELLSYLEETLPDGYAVTPHRMQYSATGSIVAWNTDSWPASGGGHPTTPSDLFDTSAFPGKRCLYGRPEVAPGTLEYALIADGVDEGNLYPLDVDRALARLDSIKSDTVFWMSGAEGIQFVLDGNCDLGWLFHGRVAAALLAEPDAPIGYSWDGAILGRSYLTIPRGAPSSAAAMSALAYGMTSENQCELLNLTGYGVPITTDCLDEFGERWAITPEVLESTLGFGDDEFYSADIAPLVEQFNSWLAQ